MMKPSLHNALFLGLLNGSLRCMCGAFSRNVFSLLPRVAHKCYWIPTSDENYSRVGKRSLLLVEATTEKENIDSSKWNPVNLGSNDTRHIISNLLVVGDGDLSFTASIAEPLSQFNTKLTATVLEDREAHQDVYQRSKANEENILSFDHEVRFGIDATKLDEFFPNQTFDRIQFNFPHWRGKANHRYNRQLIDAFLKSASEKLSPSGEIHMALVHGQGGSSASSLEEYRDTWTPSMYAAEHGLLLYKVAPFQAMYNLSSHRGVDRGFKLGAEPKMFIFGKPSNSVNKLDLKIEKKYQLCCRQELHVVLPEDYDSGVGSDSCVTGSSTLYSLKDILDGDAIELIIQGVVPYGIRVEVPSKYIIEKKDTGYERDMALFEIIYCGEGAPIRRDEVDGYRHLAEIEVEKFIPLRENRKGRRVSRPFPYYLLEHLMDSRQPNKN